MLVRSWGPGITQQRPAKQLSLVLEDPHSERREPSLKCSMSMLPYTLNKNVIKVDFFYEFDRWFKSQEEGLVVLPEDRGLVRSTHMVVNNCLTTVPGDMIPSSGFH